MKASNFLRKLKNEGKLGLIEPTEEVARSYEHKSRDCLLSAKLLLKEQLFENATGEAYYAMYNSVTSLLFTFGIKCENHSASAILLKKLLKLEKIYRTFSKSKEERIDKQYYVTPLQTTPATKESVQIFIRTAETFILEINNIKNKLQLETIKNIRKNFESM